MNIYLAANYRMHPKMRDVAIKLEHRGHVVTSDWITGTHNGHDHAFYAALDLRNLDEAEAVIFFSEAPAGSRTRGGKHVEFGYALAKGKRIFVVGECANVFHHLPEVVQRIELDDILRLIGEVANVSR